MDTNNLLGVWGEHIAAEYFRKKRYRLIAAGYECRFGEIDLIVSTRKELVFVEVKLRKSDRFAQAMEFVDRPKQERLRTTAEFYLSKYPTALQPRFDVLEIYAPDGIKTKNPQFNHLENAFE